jgi:tRNA G10  N-methylase Trm11
MKEDVMLSTTPHPATYSDDVLDVFRTIVDAESRVLDPFAGSGRIHEIAQVDFGIETVGVELEPEWACQHRDTIVGDATALPFEDNEFDYVCTSPAYGNRMADRYRPKDTDLSKRYTYRIALGRDLAAGNGASMQWGPAYRDLHERAIAEMVRVVVPTGMICVDIKDHSRAGVRQEVTAWWRETLIKHGAAYITRRRVNTGGIRNSGPVRHEHPQWVLVHEVYK